LKGAYWVFITFFDTPKAAFVSKALELKDKGLIPFKSYYDIAMDLRSVVINNFVHFDDKVVHRIGSYGRFFPELCKDPSKFVQKQPELKEVLLKLRAKGKKLFMATNAHVEYFSLVMQETFGEDW
jgi:hypothetical protein